MDKSPKKRKGFFTLKKGLARFAAENETERQEREERDQVALQSGRERKAGKTEA